MQSLQKVIEILELEEIEQNHYRAVSPNEGWQRVYGGQVIGQALVAASRTVAEDRHAHSLHGYFLRAGDTETPILYKVERIRDGRSFTTRQVVAIQKGQPIFTMSISFQIAEEGLTHQFPMPDLPAGNAARRKRTAGRTGPGLARGVSGLFSMTSAIQLRAVEPIDLMHPKATTGSELLDEDQKSLPDDPRLHQCVLAYLSDWSLLDTAMRPTQSTFCRTTCRWPASIAMWFHRPFRADEWLLYAQDGPAAGSARGFSRGLIYSRAGELVASTTQEGVGSTTGAEPPPRRVQCVVYSGE